LISLSNPVSQTQWRFISITVKNHMAAIATFVVVVLIVPRLVKVAHEVHHKLQCLSPRRVVCIILRASIGPTPSWLVSDAKLLAYDL
jgi:hypothetical protein